jgi:hypothetical protein
VVDGTGLENRHTLTGIGGSNPSLSASITFCLGFWRAVLSVFYTPCHTLRLRRGTWKKDFCLISS